MLLSRFMHKNFNFKIQGYVTALDILEKERMNTRNENKRKNCSIKLKIALSNSLFVELTFYRSNI